MFTVSKAQTLAKRMVTASRLWGEAGGQERLRYWLAAAPAWLTGIFCFSHGVFKNAPGLPTSKNQGVSHKRHRGFWLLVNTFEVWQSLGHSSRQQRRLQEWGLPPLPRQPRPPSPPGLCEPPAASRDEVTPPILAPRGNSGHRFSTWGRFCSRGTLGHSWGHFWWPTSGRGYHWHLLGRDQGCC